MFLEIELLYFVVMIAVFIVLMLVCKLPSGLCLMASAVVGAILSAIFSGTSFELRYFIEGTFGYFDTILTITTAMIFMGALKETGALDYMSALIVKVFRKFPSLLLIIFMIVIMFPAMVTGSSLASAISAGALVAPIMIKWGIPKAKTGAIIALGSILGMVAPPVNVPAMVICDVVDIPYTGFTLPLLLLSFPIAIFGVLILGRKYVKPIEKEEVSNIVDTSILTSLKWTVCIPLVVLVALIICEMIWPRVLGSLAMPGMFVIATIISFFTGRKIPLFKKGDGSFFSKLFETKDEEKPESFVEIISQGVHKSFSAMGLLMGVGMFMEVITLNGVRSYFVTNAIMFPDIVKYISMSVTLPVFGGISAFGSASVLGGPFVMALKGSYNEIALTCGLSILAALGEFLPPTAMSATFASNMVGEKKWSKVSLAALPALGGLFAYSLIYIFWFAKIVKSESIFGMEKMALSNIYLILLPIAIAGSIVLFIIINLIRKLILKKKNKLVKNSEMEVE